MYKCNYFCTNHLEKVFFFPTRKMESDINSNIERIMNSMGDLKTETYLEEQEPFIRLHTQLCYASNYVISI